MATTPLLTAGEIVNITKCLMARALVLGLTFISGDDHRDIGHLPSFYRLEPRKQKTGQRRWPVVIFILLIFPLATNLLLNKNVHGLCYFHMLQGY